MLQRKSVQLSILICLGSSILASSQARAQQAQAPLPELAPQVGAASPSQSAFVSPPVSGPIQFAAPAPAPQLILADLPDPVATEPPKKTSVSVAVAVPAAAEAKPDAGNENHYGVVTKHRNLSIGAGSGFTSITTGSKSEFGDYGVGGADGYYFSAGDGHISQARFVAQAEADKLKKGANTGYNLSLELGPGFGSGATGLNFAFSPLFYGNLRKDPTRNPTGAAGLMIEPGLYFSNGDFTAMVAAYAGAQGNFFSGLSGSARLGARLKLFETDRFFLLGDFAKVFTLAVINPSQAIANAQSEGQQIVGVANATEQCKSDTQNLANNVNSKSSQAAAEASCQMLQQNALKTGEQAATDLNNINLKNLTAWTKGWEASLSTGVRLPYHLSLELQGKVTNEPVVLQKDATTLTQTPSHSFSGSLVLGGTIR